MCAHTRDGEEICNFMARGANNSTRPHFKHTLRGYYAELWMQVNFRTEGKKVKAREGK